MKICTYCNKQYNEKEYDYTKNRYDTDDFCCFAHYVKADRMLFSEFKINSLQLTPKAAYFEIIRGAEELNIDQIIMLLEIISRDKNTIKQLMYHTTLLSQLYFDEYIFMIKNFPIEYTQQILNLVHTSYKNSYTIKCFTEILDSISEDKREILETFIVLCKLEG